ncbi:MAG TPA: class I SAM-dependent methyltransferase [bacterium]|nr:class I SAM-dependent methyltransferase [bacterium]
MNQYGESFSRFYDRYFGGHAEELAPRLLRFFAHRQPSIKISNVLDLGCGTGRLAFHLAEAGYSVSGLDLSPSMLRLAEARCRRHVLTGKAHFIQADASMFQLGESFDLILSTYNSLNHLDTLDRLQACFRSVRKCLLPGGWFFFDYHSLAGLQGWALDEKGSFEDGQVEIHGRFDAATGSGTMNIRGNFKGEIFSEEITNRSFQMEKVEGALRQEGFSGVQFLNLRDFSPCSDVERESRVGVLAN